MTFSKMTSVAESRRKSGFSSVRRFSLIAFAIAMTLCAPAITKAEHPPYLILQTPTAHSAHHPTHGYSPGHGYAARTHSYAYGWFGAPARQHWSRSFGVNRAYTQWSTK